MKRLAILFLAVVLGAGLWPRSEASAATSQLVGNGGFESGQAPWQESTANGAQLISSLRAHSGSFSAWLCGYNFCNDQLWQTVSLPASFSQVTLTYWVFIDTQEPAGSPCRDTFVSRIRTAGGSTIATPQTACNGDATNSWVQKSFDLTSAVSSSAWRRRRLVSWRARSSSSRSRAPRASSGWPTRKWFAPCAW